MTSASSFLRERRRLRILRKPGDMIQPASPRPQRRDCQGQLLAALQAMTGADVTIEQATMRPWCSATFLGAQHRIQLKIAGTDANGRAGRMTEALRDHEFTLRGHIVADVSVDEVREDNDTGAVVSLAVLTIEDW